MRLFSFCYQRFEFEILNTFPFKKITMFASIVVLYVLLSGATGNKEDVVQSKFDYQTQLLEKLIRMEYKMEQMEGRMNTMHGSVRSALELLTFTLDNKTAELEELEGDYYLLHLTAFDILFDFHCKQLLSKCQW